jgi:crotonobetainyl-CoA:carnitine CoA-transferase CaiB-like acyl-CoA transferase
VAPAGRPDVLVEGFRPDVMTCLGFGYEAVSARVPGILFVSVSGFGDRGPWATRPAMDPVLQAYTGLALANKGEDGIPRRVPISLIDMCTGMYAFQALSASLYARRDEVRGRHIKTSLLEGAAALQIVRLIATLLDGADAPVTTPPSGSYAVRDGWIQIQVVKESLWAAMCEALGVAGLASDERFDDRYRRSDNALELLALLRPAFARFTLDEITSSFNQAGILNERMNSYSDFIAHPHVVASGTVAWLQQPGLANPVPVPQIPGLPPFVDGSVRACAPGNSEHAQAILGEHGYSAAEIGELLANHVVGSIRDRTTLGAAS